MARIPKNGRARKKPYMLTLYVSGVTSRSQRAIANLNAICEEYLKDRCEVEVVDIYQFPELAKSADIVAAPTLVKQLPLPVRRLIGDLSEHSRVLLLLDVRAKDALPE